MDLARQSLCGQAHDGESYLVLRTGAGLAGKGAEMGLMVFPGAWAKSASHAMTSLALLLAATWSAKSSARALRPCGERGNAWKSCTRYADRFGGLLGAISSI